MDISAKTDYAVRAMLQLAEADAAADAAASSGDGSVDLRSRLVTTLQLADAQDLPRKFLEAILGDLRRAELVTSLRGARGGYLLSRPADRISLGAIFRAVDGPLAEVRGLRPHDTSYSGSAEHLPALWVAVRASLRRVLDETSLEQLRTGDLPDHVSELVSDPQAWENR
ncbi:RrF2 family transcriptional regulator [Kribbia dieselivorans]|uniref:RrF2 family transcriptional regulator n=1 Tax=Kribbia dieselivorans TaxID=331526 RepID=UPI0008387471|nr:Rrf2 family transcriptional regulator [Kribbia dieselivorans]